MEAHLHKATVHVDLDSFYAAVEQQRNPALRGKPVGVVQYKCVRRCSFPAGLSGRAEGPHLAPIDDHMEQLFNGLGYTVHRLADFDSFARRQGVVHCIKKYLARGS